MIVTNQAAGYAVLEWSPVDWFSIGTGAGVDTLVLPVSGSAGTWRGFSIPVVLGFTLQAHPSVRPRRNALRLGVEGAGGVDPDNGVFGWHAALTLGFAMM